jgi:transposase
VAYGRSVRERLVARMLGPEGMTVSALAEETGVSQQTLSRWRIEASTVPAMSQAKKQDGSGSAKSPRQWTPAEKLKVVLEAASLSESELGAFLRERGLHSAQLSSWRATIATALAEKRPRKADTRAEQQRIRTLEKELLRKDRALAEVTALLALRKKVEAIWGDGDGDTTRTSGK